MSSKGVVTPQCKLLKALKAIDNALEHLSKLSNFDCLECVHIDILLSKFIDVPTESKQKNSRRVQAAIRQWMQSDGAGVALLFYDGQAYWRVGDLNEAQFRELKESLHERQSYRELVQNPLATTLVLQRVTKIRWSKVRICDDFAEEIKVSQKPRTGQSLPSFTHETPCTTYGLHTPRAEEWIEPTLAQLQNLGRNENEELLIEFYTKNICTERTLMNASANTYLNIMEFANQNESTRLAILSLSASYMQQNGKSNSQEYHKADHFYMSAALHALMQELTNFESTAACLATAMLLVHHSIFNEAELGASWSCHLKVMDILPNRKIFTRSDPAVFMSHQLVLAETMQPLERLGASLSQSMDWLLDGGEDEITQISPTAGLSQQVLSAIATITSIKRIPNRSLTLELQDLLLTGTHQWTNDCTDDALQVVLDTAETYRIAALIYLHCRVFGLTKYHPIILQFSQMLYSVLVRLPINGPLYTAVYPIWPVIICNLVVTGDLRDILSQRLLNLRCFNIRVNGKNIPSSEVKKLIRILQTTESLYIATSRAHNWLECQNNGIRKDDWWEEMIAFMKMPETMLCFG